jgi:proteasome lid subunit RPN8/RPN11
MKIKITTHLWKKIEKHARESFPNECVGFYVGYGEDVEKIHIFKNIAEDKTTSSEVRKKDLKAISREVDRTNMALGETLCWIGQYHSHPTTGQTIQSKLDKAAGKKWREYEKQIIIGIKKKDGAVRKKFYYYEEVTKKWKEGKIIVRPKKA